MVKKYLAAFTRWKSWAQCHRMSVLPATDCQVALYLQYTGDTVGSKASTEEACNALAWVHPVVGLSSPVVSPIVKATLEGLQRFTLDPVTFLLGRMQL